jgi:glycyl-tRNA synthetase alpha chain
VDNFFLLDWNGAAGPRKLTYKDVSMRGEREFSAYNFIHANTDLLLQHFKDAEEECAALLKLNLTLPAYDQCIKASHLFNLLDARGVISVTERASYIGRVRTLAKGCCEEWLNTPDLNTAEKRAS